MNKVIKCLLIVVFSLSFIITNAQNYEITPIVGYQFGARVSAYNSSTQTSGDIRFVPSLNYGAAINVGIPTNNMRIEFMWTRQDTKAEWITFTTEEIDDVAVEYFMISGYREQTFDALELFGGITLGAVNVAAQSSGESQARFTVGFGGGVKYMISPAVGIRVHSRLLMPVQWFSGGFTIGTGGAGVGVGASSTIISGDVGGGIVIRLGDT
jgi:hypothetical protein